MSALNTFIEAMNDVDPSLEADARAELAQLRADLQAAEDRAKSLEEEAIIVIAHKDKVISNCTATIAEQARQLAEARPLIMMANDLWFGEYHKKCAEWLTANLAPKAEPAP